jgi:hypothetical protein
MTAPRLSELASKLLRDVPDDSAIAVDAEQRAKAIALMEQAMRRRRQHVLLTRGSLAAAAVAVLALGAGRLAGAPDQASTQRTGESAPVTVTIVGHPSGSGATVVETGGAMPMVEGRPLPAGSRIVAGDNSRASLSLSTGTELSIEENGDVAIVDSTAHQVFALRAGAIRAHVAKLAPDAQFVIQTPDAEVEVRGTSFRVAIVAPDSACADGTVTRVSVSEGVVSVRHAGVESRVAAGQRWPVGCENELLGPIPMPSAPLEHRRKVRAAQTTRNEQSSAASSGSPRDQPSSARRDQPSSARRDQPSSASRDQASSEQRAPDEPASDLAEQNDAFAKALASNKQGDTLTAISRFEAFVARYPSSSLVESALAKRMQLLRTVDRDKAARAARDYLARFPRGPARADAEAIEQRRP